jgi:lysozyme
MKLSPKGLELIKGDEGLRLKAYQDQKGIWTIGYGHTLGVTPGMVITKEEALSLLDEDADSAESDINRLVKVSLSQNEFDALVGIRFNIGSGYFAGSTLLRKLNAGDKAGAADQFLVWNKLTMPDGTVVESDGHTTRRNRERMLFLTPDGMAPIVAEAVNKATNPKPAPVAAVGSKKNTSPTPSKKVKTKAPIKH